MVAAMREGLGRAPHLMRVPAGAVKRLMATFGKEAEWERLSGNFVIDAAKLRGIGWDPARQDVRRHRRHDARPNGAGRTAHGLSRLPHGEGGCAQLA